ncbi:hypothetical protein, partial [Consotaella aegiceratis]|uniref:hypothetical protein n=1 Tax=Consotaella aegiceratis TaxID=3097961 RepID=UPI002F3E4ACA
PTSTTVSIDLLVDKLIPCFWLLRIKQELRLLAEFTRPTSDRLSSSQVPDVAASHDFAVDAPSA